ncbi:leucokinins-like [Topomyia yanbarensis]|uniref:leucokinins-like n=1 Tax=Topomyia yanbarensis TaxID=2498891 RepID=UPI00273AAE57|nr:leucokinins-like [Topomyia yanbarensis]
MKISIHLAFTLLAAVVGFRCSELDTSDRRLVDILNGCEWVTRRNVISEALLERYRKYMMQIFFIQDDVCAVYEWNKHLRENELAEENGLEEVEENDSNDKQNSRESSAPPASPFAHLTNSSCDIGAKELYICMSSQFEDTALNAMILNNLELICDPRHSTSTIEKRNSKYVSKQKFFSWGGKRSNAHVFYPWGGKRSLPTGRVPRQPKVVIRNPFHSWGGKRSQPGAMRG